MPRLIVPVLIAFLVSLPVAAGEGERLSKLKQLCISDQGTGFNWENGGWKAVKFVEHKYIVTLVPEKRILDIARDWSDNTKRLEREYEDRRILLACVGNAAKEREYIRNPNHPKFEQLPINLYKYQSCLRIQKMGSEYSTLLSCAETHYDPSGALVTESVPLAKSARVDLDVEFDCRGESLGLDSHNIFNMRPNGHFHRGSVHDDLDPDDSYKDSLIIEVGQCADISD